MFPELKLNAAASLFVSAHGNEVSESERSDLVAAGLNEADPAVVAAEICETLEKAADLPEGYRSAAFWALAKRFDSELTPFFRRHLRVEMERDMEVAYQIMIALDNLEEPVWPVHRSGGSIQNHQANRHFASVYLDQHG